MSGFIPSFVSIFFIVDCPFLVFMLSSLYVRYPSIFICVFSHSSFFFILHSFASCCDLCGCRSLNLKCQFAPLYACSGTLTFFLLSST